MRLRLMRQQTSTSGSSVGSHLNLAYVLEFLHCSKIYPRNQTLVKPPRVLESALSLECEVHPLGILATPIVTLIKT